MKFSITAQFYLVREHHPLEYLPWPLFSFEWLLLTKNSITGWHVGIRKNWWYIDSPVHRQRRLESAKSVKLTRQSWILRAGRRRACQTCADWLLVKVCSLFSNLHRLMCTFGGELQWAMQGSMGPHGVPTRFTVYSTSLRQKFRRQLSLGDRVVFIFF